MVDVIATLLHQIGGCSLNYLTTADHQKIDGCVCMTIAVGIAQS